MHLKKGNKMATKKLTNEELLEIFKEMSLVELSDFVKLFEETFDVTAAAPVAAPAAPAGDEASGQEAEEAKSKYDVVLESAGDKKIMVIKAVREINPGLGLAEAKAVVDEAPKTIVQGMKAEEAQAAKAKLEQAGATITLK
jgi:large subunit ribosomal protein L7/L12